MTRMDAHMGLASAAALRAAGIGAANCSQVGSNRLYEALVMCMACAIVSCQRPAPVATGFLQTSGF